MRWIMRFGGVLMILAGGWALYKVNLTGDPRWLASIVLGFGGGIAFFTMTG